jgi:hypothetical protein
LEETNSQTDKVNIYVQKENLAGEAQNDENLEKFLKVENVKCSRMYDKNLALLKATNLTSICCV